MEDNLLDIKYRKQIINEIKGNENVQRKIASYKKYNMQSDNFYQYVKEYLESKLDCDTVSEMSIFSSVNLQKRISKAEASVYKRPPKRTINLSGVESEELEYIYSEMGLNTTLRLANEAYKYDGQCAIQIYPCDGELKSRVLFRHQYDVIPDHDNPEMAMAYVISNFDNSTRDMVRKSPDRTGSSQGDQYRDMMNQAIADNDDAALGKERYTVWSKKYNFIMNGHGEILDKETEEVVKTLDVNDKNIISPLSEYECIPFVDIAGHKNFEFWVRGFDCLYDATITYNVILTAEFQTVELQGSAVAYYKGSADHMPENLKVGPNKIIHIPIDPNNAVNSEFGFANPGSDLGSIREFRESYLTAFLTSRGLDSGLISGNPQTNVSSSGTEKLLQMVEKFEAGQEDFSLFECAENDILYIVYSWIKSFNGETINGKKVLGDDFNITLPENFEDVSLNLRFSGPEMIKTESEKLDIAQKELDLGITSKVHIIMDLKNMTEDEAVKYLLSVQKFEDLNGIRQSQVQQAGSISEVQS